MMGRALGCIGANGLTLAAATALADAVGEPAEFFEAKVRPVLAGHCFGCHGPRKQKGGLRLDSPDAMRAGGDSGPAVVPGDPEGSPLVEAIRYDGAVQMPPKGKLDDAAIAALTEWVRRGAHWPAAEAAAGPAAASTTRTISAADANFWSFRPVRDVQPPAVQDVAWPRTPIDAFVLAKLEEAGLHPAPEADKRTLLRRATFDLTGLPPTPEEVEAFLRDESPDAFARVVDRLLASPHYGERWARHWLDVARYGEDQAHSFQPRLYPQGYRYRDWVVRALTDDMPYDRFVTEQIAADRIEGPGRADHLAALGFFACGPVYYGDPKKLDQVDDRIDTMTRGFLGLTVACARCHDHKFDPIPTTDYYALAGVFLSTDYREVPCAPPEQVAAYDAAQAAIKAQKDQIDAFLKAEATRLAEARGGKAVPKDRIETELPEEARATLKQMRREMQRLQAEAPPKYPVIHALAEAATPADMTVLVRGNPEAPGPAVPRRFLSALGGAEAPFTRGSGRLELARAIASPENPLTARVLVNRVWQHHFGRGLVGTPSNFGALGERPSHPELLDDLARRFVAGGWSIKALHRAILLSATYRQGSQHDPHAPQVDPDNRLLGRMSPRRLEVEAWRDALLAVSGRLDPALGGPSRPLDDPANRRRTLYAAVSRHDLAPLLRLFDFPDPNITAAERTRTTVPLQQLVVLNDELVVAAARALAARLRADPAGDGHEDDAARLRRAYLLLFGRPATEPEVRLGLGYLGARDPDGPPAGDLSRWERYAQVLLGTNEFLFID
ncbi:MAG TPA: PSD1 and planctomycete cytochrome C domain-containing protein [Isosphaeraceae bacterium]